MTTEPENAGPSEVVIEPQEAGQRIDNWLLRRLKGWSRGDVYRLLRSGQVRINKGRIRPGYRLNGGDRLRLPPQARHARDPENRSAAAVPPSLLKRLANAVLFEDQDLLVVDKPAGMAVHAGSSVVAGVIEALRAQRPQAGVLELVHRLDRETSGCLLLAKNRDSLLELHRQFRDGEVEKRYLALVAGDWQLGEHRADLPLEVTHRRGGERHVRVEEGGKPAVTAFRYVQAYRGCTLLEVSPETGRTHQIRVHAAALGHPLAGDERYGDETFNRLLAGLGLRRLFLHAHMLTFRHPRSGEPGAFSTPLPEELRVLLERLPG